MQDLQGASQQPGMTTSTPPGVSASSPATPSIIDQLAADLAAPGAPKPEEKVQRQADQGWQRQAELTARAGLNGVTALPNMVWNGLAGVGNLAMGKDVIPLADANKTVDALGLSSPQSKIERVSGDVASAMAGAGGSMGLGKILATYGAPAAASVGNAIQSLPGMQIVSSGIGAGSASEAKELGLNPWWQGAAGLVGGAAGAVGSSLASAGVNRLSNALRTYNAEPLSKEIATDRAQSGFDKAVKDMGPQGGQLFAPQEIESLKTSIIPQVQNNPAADVGAIVRKQDFRNLGMEGTTGQVTRDPTQYAAEQNIRGLSEGQPLTNRFNQQNSQLQNNLYGLVGGTKQAYESGTALKSALSGIDDKLRNGVSDAYKTASASSGKLLDIPLYGIAQDYGRIVKEFGDAVPSGVRNSFNDYGLLTGKQNKLFTIDDAEKLLQVINKNGSNEPATINALNELRLSVKNAILTADDKGGVFAPARELAKQRFDMHDKIPALEAAFANKISPDDFVRRFVTTGKTDDVAALGALLKTESPALFGEVRSQLGNTLYKAAFGSNPGGDGKFNPAAYKNALESVGDAKLAAFFKPDEIAQLHNVGRVGAYMNSYPGASPVNTSNTASALGSMLEDGMKKIPMVGGWLQNAKNRAFVSDALRGGMNKPMTQAQSFTPDALAAGLLRSTAPNQVRN